MKPRYLCSSLLHNFLARKALSKLAHILEIARRKAFLIGKLSDEVKRQPVDHLGPPTFCLLTLQNQAPDLPVEENQLLSKKLHPPCGMMELHKF